MKRYVVRHQSGDYVRLVNQPAGEQDQLVPLFVRFREDATIFETPKSALLSIFGSNTLPLGYEVIKADVTITFDDSILPQEDDWSPEQEFWNVVAIDYGHDYLAERDMKEVAADHGAKWSSLHRMTSTELALRIKTGQLDLSNTDYVYLGEHAYRQVTAEMVKQLVKDNWHALFVFDVGGTKLRGRRPIFPEGSYMGVDIENQELINDCDC
jgi:hypothetical protein|nr:MAG TPA: hypothetical protein [Caudoviricetes sp.]